MFRRLKSLVFGRKTEKPNVIVSRCKKPGAVERWVTWLLSHGVQPKHVVLVLDSTREDFLRKVSPSDVIEADLNISWRIISLACQLGSQEVTAQLLQTFPPRKCEDMQPIYKYLRKTLKNFLNNGVEIDRYGVCFRTFGDLTKLPKDIQRLIAKIEIRTRQNRRLRANVTFGNAARHSTSVAIANISTALVEGKLRSEDLTYEFLEDQLSGALPSPTDVYIKTSDVNSLYASLERLLPVSLLTKSFIYNLFIKDYLPDLAFWTYAKALLDYQTSYAILQQRRRKTEAYEAMFRNIASETRKKEFQQLRELTRHQALNQLLVSERPVLSMEPAPRGDTKNDRESAQLRRTDAFPSPAPQKRFTLGFCL